MTDEQHLREMVAAWKAAGLWDKWEFVQDPRSTDPANLANLKDDPDFA